MSVWTDAAQAQNGDRDDQLFLNGGPVAATADDSPGTIVVAPFNQAGTPSAPSVFIGAISFAGLEALTPADFADLVAPRLGRAWSPGDLRDFSTMVAKRLQARGFAFASASIEPQKVLAGVLRVNVDEGRIDELRFVGEASPAVRRALAPLIATRALRFAEIERCLLLAGDIDGARIEGSRYVREAGRGILIVQVAHDRASARFDLNDAGTKPIGRVQARIEVNLNGLLASDDSLSLTYSAAPAEPSELQFGYLRYEKRISASGTELVLTGSASFIRPGAYLAPLHIRNRAWFASASLLQPLLRSRKASFWVEGELGVRNLTQWRSHVRNRDDRVITARLTLYGYKEFAGGRARVGATFTQGLGIFGATTSRDVYRSRFDADGSFTTANLWADWTRNLGGNISLRLAAQGQVSSQPLLLSEEFGLGGTSFLRGYDWGERSGDEGFIGVVELRYLWKQPVSFVKRAQLYTFLDGGTVSNLDDGFGGGSLASTGGGARIDISNRLGLTLEVAVPLSGERYDTGTRAPKFNFGVSRTF